MSRRRLWLAALLLLLLLPVGIVVAIPRLRPSAAATGSAEPPAMAPPIRHALERAALPAELHGITIAEARAFAVLGRLDDAGGAPDADGTGDAGAFARSALDAQQPRSGDGRAYATTGGTIAIGLPPARQTVRRTKSDASAAGPGGGATTDARTTLRGTASTAIESHDGDYTIGAPGVWAAISHQPGDGPVRITDRSGAGHAIRLDGKDFGTVRVNGGIVVPGRFYRVGDGVVITADAPIGIDIVPLDATPEYYDEPFRLPVGSG